MEIKRIPAKAKEIVKNKDGKISYLPHITRSDKGEPFVREWKES